MHEVKKYIFDGLKMAAERALKPNNSQCAHMLANDDVSITHSQLQPAHTALLALGRYVTRAYNCFTVC